MNQPLTVNLQGAADMMKVHPKTVIDLIHSGAIPAAKVGRAYVMMTKDVLQYVENRIITQTADRMRSTTSRRPGRNRAGSHSA